jgi:hypothetical protein
VFILFCFIVRPTCRPAVQYIGHSLQTGHGGSFELGGPPSPGVPPEMLGRWRSSPSGLGIPLSSSAAATTSPLASVMTTTPRGAVRHGSSSSGAVGAVGIGADPGVGIGSLSGGGGGGERRARDKFSGAHLHSTSGSTSAGDQDSDHEDLDLAYARRGEGGAGRGVATGAVSFEDMDNYLPSPSPVGSAREPNVFGEGAGADQE